MQETFLRNAGSLCFSTCSPILYQPIYGNPMRNLINASIGINGIQFVLLLQEFGKFDQIVKEQLKT